MREFTLKNANLRGLAGSGAGPREMRAEKLAPATTMEAKPEAPSESPPDERPPAEAEERPASLAAGNADKKPPDERPGGADPPRQSKGGESAESEAECQSGDGSDDRSICCLRLESPLEQLQVAAVLEFVRMHRRTGKVTVCTERHHGVIHLVDGEAVFASTGEQQGFPAFTTLMDSTNGTVVFSAEPVPEDLQNLSCGTIPLMMDALRLLDERDSQLRR
jgi:hypothetical protein